ncbi:hypothetical protein K1T71_012673 [Dendrolimus kikuchii]|uniref:Uncharacterized protein n=1 Tax=Dendrolimus kikuchii TaxID=765133 RepID=A0ACC1CK70_9NEOP|nr:hypothetical protein K1T71_012673 [Dendrolimus kikuchii]
MSQTLLFESTLKRTEFLYRYAGINIRSGERKASDKFKSRCVYIFNFFWLNIDLAGGIWWFIDGVKRGKDFFGLTYIAPCISLTTLANIKSIFIVLNEDKVHKLIDAIKALELKENSRKFVEKKKAIMKEETDFLNVVIYVINILYLVLVVAFAIMPLVVIAVKYANTHELELILPFLILYPFDPFNYKVWPFVYLHQFWSECIVSLDICGVDHFFIMCCTYLRIQFRLLRHDFENIISIRSNNRLVMDDDDFRAKFIELIKWHQKLIELVSILESIYTKSTLLNFTSSSLIICLTGFNVTVVKEFSYTVIFLSFLFMSLVQVFFLCFFADLLTTSSMEISNAVYNSQWYMAEPKVGKQLLLVQTRAQDPCKLTACGFADVNLNSFMRVLSTAWSYFALLQTMYGG